MNIWKERMIKYELDMLEYEKNRVNKNKPKRKELKKLTTKQWEKPFAR